MAIVISQNSVTMAITFDYLMTSSIPILTQHTVTHPLVHSLHKTEHTNEVWTHHHTKNQTNSKNCSAEWLFPWWPKGSWEWARGRWEEEGDEGGTSATRSKHRRHHASRLETEHQKMWRTCNPLNKRICSNARICWSQQARHTQVINCSSSLGDQCLSIMC